MFDSKASKEPSQSSMTSVRRGVIAFDFDETIINADSGLAIIEMADSEFPEDIKQLYSKDTWTDWLGAIFAHLHDGGVGKKDMLTALSALPFVEGMPTLLKWLFDHDFEIIVISDSNSYFIQYILEVHDLSQYVTKVFSNPAYFDDKELLKIEWFHVQDYCQLSTKNMCKGKILEDYIEKRKEENVSFCRKYYCGDGSNDFCPSLKLEEGDVTFPRIGFTLESKLKKSDSLKATVFPWATGHQIRDFLIKYSL